MIKCTNDFLCGFDEEVSWYIRDTDQIFRFFPDNVLIVDEDSSVVEGIWRISDNGVVFVRLESNDSFYFAFSQKENADGEYFIDKAVKRSGKFKKIATLNAVMKSISLVESPGEAESWSYGRMACVALGVFIAAMVAMVLPSVLPSFIAEIVPKALIMTVLFATFSVVFFSVSNMFYFKFSSKIDDIFD